MIYGINGYKGQMESADMILEMVTELRAIKKNKRQLLKR